MWSQRCDPRPRCWRTSCAARPDTFIEMQDLASQIARAPSDGKPHSDSGAARLRHRGNRLTCRRGFTQRPRHKRRQGRQRGENHLGARSNAHHSASHAVEHPEGNFLPAAWGSPVGGASRASRAHPLNDIMDPDQTAAPGMSPIKHPAGAGPMGGLALGCTMRSVRTVRSARKPRLSWPLPQGRHAGPEANEPGFSRIRWSNIGDKSNRPWTNPQTGLVGHSRSIPIVDPLLRGKIEGVRMT